MYKNIFAGSAKARDILYSMVDGFFSAAADGDAVSSTHICPTCAIVPYTQ